MHYANVFKYYWTKINHKIPWINVEYVCNTTKITIQQGGSSKEVPFEFKCETTQRCIEYSYKCDGQLDCCREDRSGENATACPDKTDETDCGTLFLSSLQNVAFIFVFSLYKKFTVNHIIVKIYLVNLF